VFGFKSAFVKFMPGSYVMIHWQDGTTGRTDPSLAPVAVLWIALIRKAIRVDRTLAAPSS
jgi:hypothetical protein